MFLAYMPTTSEWIRIVIITSLLIALIVRNAGFIKKMKQRKKKETQKQEMERKRQERKEERVRQAQEAKKQHEAAKRKTEQSLVTVLGDSGLVSKQVDVAGYHMWYLEGGAENATKPPVLLLHGFVTDKEIWIDLGRRLIEAGHRVIIPDLPVFGQNPKTDKLPLDVMSQTKRIRALVQQLNASPTHIVGLSLGAMVGAAYAYGAADEVLSLVLIEPLGIRVPYETELDEWIKQDRNPLFIANPAAYDNLLGFLCPQPPEMEATLKDYRAEHLAKYRKFYLQAWMEACTGERSNLLDLILPEVKQRTFFLGGKESKIVHPATPEVASRMMPDARGEVLEDCGHLPMLEKPEETARLILQFISA